MTVLPFGKSAMISGSMLGLGRALGETMAVAIILSVSGGVSFNLISRQPVDDRRQRRARVPRVVGPRHQRPDRVRPRAVRGDAADQHGGAQDHRPRDPHVTTPPASRKDEPSVQPRPPASRRRPRAAVASRSAPRPRRSPARASSRWGARRSPRRRCRLARRARARRLRAVRRRAAPARRLQRGGVPDRDGRADGDLVYGWSRAVEGPRKATDRGDHAARHVRVRARRRAARSRCSGRSSRAGPTARRRLLHRVRPRRDRRGRRRLARDRRHADHHGDGDAHLRPGRDPRRDLPPGIRGGACAAR